MTIKRIDLVNFSKLFNNASIATSQEVSINLINLSTLNSQYFDSGCGF